MCCECEPCHIDCASVRTSGGGDANRAWIDYTSISGHCSLTVFDDDLPIPAPASLASWDGKIDWSCSSTFFAFQCMSRSKLESLPQPGFSMLRRISQTHDNSPSFGHSFPCVTSSSSGAPKRWVSCPHKGCLKRSAHQEEALRNPNLLASICLIWGSASRTLFLYRASARVCSGLPSK